MFVPDQKYNIAYVITLFCSAFYFLYLRFAWNKKVPELFYWIHFFIVSWSATMYLNMVFSTPLAQYAYYADWILSTPLIMLALALTAMYPLTNINWPLLFGMIVTQFFMIVTGILAHISPTEQAMLSFFAIGNGLLFLMLYFVFGPLRTIAKSSNEIARKVNRLSFLLLFFWISYPAIWILGTPGYAYFSPTVTQFLFILLPILCKPVFGIIDLYLLKSLKH